MTTILIAAMLAGAGGQEEPLRVGIVGLDTSHVIAFTRMLNDPKDANHVPGARVICAWKGGSPDVKSSSDRVDGFTEQIQKRFGVEIVGTIEELCTRVDAVLLESVDGRVHLEQVRPIFKARKRVFIDKPLTASLADGREIARLSKESGTPFFSASALRFNESTRSLLDNPKIGRILGCDVWTPAPTEPHHPDLSWYGVHGVEMLFALMGEGCVSLRRAPGDGVDVITARWKDGRLATLRAIRKGKSGYGAVVFGEKSVQASPPRKGSIYKGLVEEIVKFFKTGVQPVSTVEMLEVLAFMDAADASKAKDGAEIRLDALK